METVNSKSTGQDSLGPGVLTLRHTLSNRLFSGTFVGADISTTATGSKESLRLVEVCSYPLYYVRKFFTFYYSRNTRPRNLHLASKRVEMCSASFLLPKEDHNANGKKLGEKGYKLHSCYIFKLFKNLFISRAFPHTVPVNQRETETVVYLTAVSPRATEC